MNKSSKLKKLRKYLKDASAPYRKQKAKDAERRDDDGRDEAVKSVRNGFKTGEVDFFLKRCFDPDEIQRKVAGAVVAA